MDNVVKPQVLRTAIADSVAAQLKSYDVAAFCQMLGLEGPADGEDPFKSKRLYVGARLAGRDLHELLSLAQRVLAQWDDETLQQLVDASGARGVGGDLRNLIFASAGPKPKIVLRDAINNVIDIVENADSCLVYDRPLPAAGLTWSAMVTWWAEKLDTGNLDVAARALWQRLNVSLDSDPERMLFRWYTRRYMDGFHAPALVPQVYLHYDPYVRQKGAGPLFRQRMDFLLLLPGRRRVVIEIDGRHHYARPDGVADPSAYAAMVAEDRHLRLAGYEVHRFGGSEFVDAEAAEVQVATFFDRLLA